MVYQKEEVEKEGSELLHLIDKQRNQLTIKNHKIATLEENLKSAKRGFSPKLPEYKEEEKIDNCGGCKEFKKMEEGRENYIEQLNLEIKQLREEVNFLEEEIEERQRIESISE